MEIKAYGKINLSLDVIGRREDGYHLVRMIMQTVDIYDTVTITVDETARDAEGGIAIRTDSGHIPGGPDNLVWRAADVMKREYGITDPLAIDLVKRIPIAAGMAGGSSDAAAVFRGIRDMYDLAKGSQDASDARLQELALPLGADIPYCITGGTQLSEGIGEILTPLPAPPTCTLLVVKPDLYVSTGWVYNAFDSIPAEDVIHPDVDAMIAANARGDLQGICDNLGNVLEQQTGAEYPIIGELEQFFRDHGADGALMTGSGPTVFAIYADATAADAAYEALSAEPAYAAFQRFKTSLIHQI